LSRCGSFDSPVTGRSSVVVDHEPIPSAPRRQPEGHPHRVLLGFRQGGEVVEHRRAQLVQRCELGLHPGELSDATAGRLTRAVVQQRGLADPGLTADDQYGALAVPDAVQQAIESLALA
jgi:hypothetical protein